MREKIKEEVRETTEHLVTECENCDQVLQEYDLVTDSFGHSQIVNLIITEAGEKKCPASEDGRHFLIPPGF